MTRRELILAGAAAPLAVAAARTKPSLILFSKHLPKHGYDELGKACKDFGFDGVDLTVRPKGHVLPENVTRDLPRAVEALRSRGQSVPMITTGLISPDDPAAEPTLATAGKLKVPFFKFGYWRYRETPVERKMAEVKGDVAGLVAIAKTHGIAAGFHNHSGDYVGTSVWDSREIIADMDPKWVGFYFDPCHATAEGGRFAWQSAFQIAAKRLKMIALKDFYWAKRDGQWRMTMCPLGEGMVDWEKFFSMLAAARFTGPVSLHVEYHADDEMQAIANDLAFMKRMVAKAYK
ncbi:MAG: sugar phosphate isomerase/epimerase [bacterium]|nr:sugar phosphate isomerase/epimerase [bacterium]